MIIPEKARNRVVHGWVFANHPPEVVEAIGKFLAYGDTDVLNGTPYEALATEAARQVREGVKGWATY